MCEITFLSPCVLYLFSFFNPRNFSNEDSSLNAILPHEKSNRHVLIGGNSSSSQMVRGGATRATSVAPTRCCLTGMMKSESYLQSTCLEFLRVFSLSYHVFMSVCIKEWLDVFHIMTCQLSIKWNLLILYGTGRDDILRSEWGLGVALPTHSFQQSGHNLLLRCRDKINLFINYTLIGIIFLKYYYQIAFALCVTHSFVFTE